MLAPRTLTRVLSILIVILLLIGIVLGFLLFQARAGIDEHRAAATDSSETAASADLDPAEISPETAVENAPATPASTSADSAPSSSPAPSPTSSASTANPPADAPLPVGLSSNGWNDNAATSCGSGESLVFAGRGGGNWVTVCSSGGTLNYRGDVFDGVLSATVDQSASNPDAGYFSVPAAPHTIVINKSGLVVRDGSTTVSQAGFSESYLAN